MMAEEVGGNVTNKSSHFQVKSSLQLCRSQLRKLCMTLMLNVYIIVALSLVPRLFKVRLRSSAL